MKRVSDTVLFIFLVAVYIIVLPFALGYLLIGDSGLWTDGDNKQNDRHA